MSTPRTRRPPALGRALLWLTLPRDSVGETIAGDLEQEFQQQPRGARAWYLRHASGIAWRATRDRLRGRDWSVAPPSGTRPPDRARRGGALARDLRFAGRQLLQRPVFSVVAILTLAIGIGINTAIFSVVNALLLTPIPAIREPSTIVEIARGTDDIFVDVAFGAFEILRADATTLQDVAGWDGLTLSYRDAGDREATVLSGREVTGNYFSVLGVQPALGRFFAPEQSFYPNVADEVVITHRLWQSRYGGSADVLGREVLINGYPARIIGVAAEGFAGHQILVQREVFLPIGMPAPGMLGPPEIEAVRSGYMVLLGRLAEGVGIDAVREEVTALGDRFYSENGIDEPYRLRADPYGAIPGSDRSTVGLFFGMLMIIVAMVLVIACVNVANMLLSRAVERRREIAIRMSLGAGRWQLLRQLLTESAVLFLTAAAAGLLLASWTTDTLVNLYLPQMASTQLYLDVTPDSRVLAFTFGVAVLTSIVFGLAPALTASRAGSSAAIRTGAAHHRRSRLRAALVGGQMAITVVLLIAAGLMTRALYELESVDLGFDVDGVYSVSFDLEHAGYNADRSRIFYAELLDAIGAIPGVESVASARKLPMASQSSMGGIFPDGIETPTEHGFAVDFNRVSADYFRTVGIALLEGREFDAFDDIDTPRVAVINAAMATRLWGDEAAVGKRFSIGRGMNATSYEVIGIAADANYHTFVEETPNFLYLAATQSPDSIAHVMVRSDDLQGTVGHVRAAVAELDAGVPIVEVTPLREVVAGFSMGQRLAAWVAGVVGAVGLLLGAVGVYGVTAFAVSQRRHEIGVRIALGARTADVRRLMLRSGLRAPLTGMALGLVAAAAAAQLIASFLYGVSPLDPWTYLGVVLVLGAAAGGATLLPAQRAARVDPVNTLRSD